MTLRLVMALLALLQSGCATVDYYAQAVGGHFEVMGRASPISEVVANTRDEGLRGRLAQAIKVRAFAVSELKLPDNGSYKSYADLARPFVVWNLVAAPELSLAPKTWCYLVVGCLAYRGYYDESQARAHAAALEADGYDVTVGGVRAYSTLGWFDDPLLNTMLAPPPPYLQGVMFHELAHQQLYADDDSAFNEAFATAVEHEGVRRWLARFGSPGARSRYDAAQLRRSDFTALVMRYRQKLAQLYASDAQQSEKRTGKAALLQRMRADYRELAERWGNDAYGRYFDAGLNNARLAAVATYLKWVPAFAALLQREGGDLPRFYQAAAALAELPLDARRRALSTLCAEATCDAY